MFAMSVSPLTKALLNKIDPALEKELIRARGEGGKSLTGNLEYKGSTFKNLKSKVGRDDRRFGGKLEKSKDENVLSLGGELFDIIKVKGKKIAVLPVDRFAEALKREKDSNKLAVAAALRGKLILKGGTLLEGEKIELIMKVVQNLNITPVGEKDWPRGMNVKIGSEEENKTLIDGLQYVLRATIAKSRTREFGFITLFTDGKATYWFKVSRGFTTALNESLSSLETLIDETNTLLSKAQKAKVNMLYRTLNGMYE